MRRFLFIIVFLLSCITYGYSQSRYSTYEEGGKYGVLYNGEIVLYPRFDAIYYCGPNFVYKKNNRAGFATIWKLVTEPFCDSLVRMENVYNKDYIAYKFLDKKKWGICTSAGRIIIPAKYDEINDSIFQSERLLNYKWSKKDYRNVGKWTEYMVVKDAQKYKVIDLLDSTIVESNRPFMGLDEYPYRLEKIFLKIARKRNEQRNHESEIKIVKSIFKDFIDDTKSTQIHYVSGTYGGYDPFHYREPLKSWKISDYKIEDFKKPSNIDLGKGRYLEEANGDTIIVGGFKGVTNSYGFVSIPLVYQSPYFRIQRNPLDVGAHYEIVNFRAAYNCNYDFKNTRSMYFVSAEKIENGAVDEDLHSISERIAEYVELLDMAESINDTYWYKKISEEKEDLERKYEKIEMGCNYILRQMRNDARIAQLAQTMRNIAASLGSASKGYSYSSGSYNSNSGSTSNYQSNKTGGANKMSMSDLANYNSLRTTYNKWAADLMQMKNSNGRFQNGFKISDKKHAQDEMKRIRRDALNKWGKEIPYNSIEDW